MVEARLLVVDDEPDFAWAVAALLETEGYAVDIAENGEAAWQVLCSRRVDLVVCDLQMPVMDGVELYKRHAGDGRSGRPPFIFIELILRTRPRRCACSADLTRSSRSRSRSKIS